MHCFINNTKTNKIYKNVFLHTNSVFCHPPINLKKEQILVNLAEEQCFPKSVPSAKVQEDPMFPSPCYVHSISVIINLSRLFLLWNSTGATLLEKLIDDAIAQLYKTKFSTISLYLTKLYVT